MKKFYNFDTRPAGATKVIKLIVLDLFHSVMSPINAILCQSLGMLVSPQVGPSEVNQD